ncbi:hypothetical protein IU421_04850 [Nocardia cyriacigeorgica]|uniref:hypothetical protein n=1 Tax=Nocardia cyriacigeorgica TaxID=135487 RepID=UPI0018950402|nr:hypothetical protein [Nocardia cyriacigeorgica]MBF6158987.1 hypothetical protein [Nocardia cyriacigeorgica]MBF6197327.1 hypothetical protein [Nocardia cyriacigeorgica]MBF6319002.1 hypothetical protein [Nocardia cyriacigeorgica]MBF6513609.1 hypothetical protein [Nocardia cyriacigeorgica]MBF6531487.1 hypothetical protein [Nocardia cyriacigeorgica]
MSTLVVVSFAIVDWTAATADRGDDLVAVMNGAPPLRTRTSRPRPISTPPPTASSQQDELLTARVGDIRERLLPWEEVAPGPRGVSARPDQRAALCDSRNPRLKDDLKLHDGSRYSHWRREANCAET